MALNANARQTCCKCKYGHGNPHTQNPGCAVAPSGALSMGRGVESVPGEPGCVTLGRTPAPSGPLFPYLQRVGCGGVPGLREF